MKSLLWKLMENREVTPKDVIGVTSISKLKLQLALRGFSALSPKDFSEMCSLLCVDIDERLALKKLIDVGGSNEN
ncbi:MAG: hypothetical protein LW852_12320 [Sediminibacterium sp.]|jgi:hypothetical protein|nr:hypothetical protein [Sediminibacterium sp.]